MPVLEQAFYSGLNRIFGAIPELNLLCPWVFLDVLSVQIKMKGITGKSLYCKIKKKNPRTNGLVLPGKPASV